MKTMFKQNREKLFWQKRLVYMGEIPEAKAPDPKMEKKDTAPDKKEAEKSPGEKLDKKQEILETIRTGKVEIKPANYMQFRKALAKEEAVQSAEKAWQQNSKEAKEGSNDYIANTLVQGVIEFAATGDQMSKIDKNPEVERNKIVNEWMKKNNIAQFQIEGGKWHFFNEKGQDVEFTTQLNPEPGKQTKVKEAALNKEFAAKQDAKKAVETAAAEKIRKDPNNLKDVTSTKIDLDAKMTIGDMLTPLEKSLKKDEKSVPDIKMEEMKAGLISYMNEAGIKGDEKAQFAEFLGRVMKDGFIKVAIENGKFVFQKATGEKTSNPLGIIKEDANKKMKAREAYAHEALRTSDDIKKDAAEKKVIEDKRPMVTPLDSTESEVAKILGKSSADVDKRYLRAMESILKFNDNPPVEVNFPFNDAPMPCKFYISGNGAYILSWENGKGYHQFTPKEKGPAGLNEAKAHFASIFDNGNLAKEIQDRNVMEKQNFVNWGQKIDEGPKVESGLVKYEFDWDTGALGDDPDVLIKTLPHGELEVTVVQKDIPDSPLKAEKGQYKFVAAGFQDMMRTVHTLQNYVENFDKASPADKEKMQKDEADRGFLEKGPLELQKEAGSLDVGKLLRVISNRNNIGAKDHTAELKYGYNLEFDWMQKLEPSQKVQIAKLEGSDNYTVFIQPNNERLGVIQSPINKSFHKLMELVAAQKENIMTRGGQEKMIRGVNDILKQYNAPKFDDQGKPLPQGPEVELAKNVQVVSMSEGFVYLSMDGMAPRGFILSKSIDDAVSQGYLIRKSPELAVAEKSGEKLAEPPKPKDKIEASVDKKEETLDSKEKTEAVNAISKKIFNAVSKPRVDAFLASSANGLKVPEGEKDKTAWYQRKLWSMLGEYAGMSPLPTESSPKQYQEYQIKVAADINNKSKLFAERTDASAQKELGEKFDEYKGFPRVKAYLEGLKKSLSIFDTSDFKPESLTKLKDQYMAGFKELLDDIIQKTDKKGLDGMSLDKKVMETLRSRIKLPQTFAKEFAENEKKREDYDKYSKEKPRLDKLDKEKKDYLESKNGKWHLMDFPEFRKQGLAGVGAEALITLKKIVDSPDGYLKEGDVHLAKTPGNSPTSESMSFNIKYKNMPFTLNFYKVGEGKVRVASAEGWNNTSKSNNVGIYDESLYAGSYRDPVDFVLSNTMEKTARLNGGSPYAAGIESSKKPEVKKEVPKKTA